MKRIAFILVVWLLVFCTTALAQEQGTTASLDQLIEVALENNYLLRAAENRIAANEADVKFIRKNLLPEAGISVNASYWKWLMPNKQKLLGSQLSDVYAELALKQMLFDGGKNRSQTQIARFAVLGSQEARRSLRQAIIYNVAYSWLELHKADQTIRIHQNALEQLNNHLANSQALYRIGKVSTVDILKVKVQIAAEKKAITAAASLLEQKQIQFNEWLGTDEFPFRRGDPAARTLWDRWQHAEFSPRSLLEQALKEHPDLKQSDWKIAAKQKEKSLYQAERLPNVSAFGLFNWEDNYLPFGNHFNYNLGIGISYRIPLFKGSAYQDKILASRLAAQELENEKKQQIQGLSAAFAEVISELANKKIEVSANEEIMALSRETLDNSLLRYNAGQGDIIDVLDARSILTQAEDNRQKSALEYLQQIAKVNYLSGRGQNPFTE